MHELAIAKCGVVPVFAKPKAGVQIDEVFHGMPCILIKNCGEFSRVKTFYGYEGFVDTNSIKIEQINNSYNDVFKNARKEHLYSNEFLKACFSNSKESHIVKAPFIDALEKPKVQATILDKLPKGALLQIKGKVNKNGWQKILLHSGKAAYVKQEQIEKMPYFSTQTKFCKKSEIKQLRKNICKTALSYLGTQYTWGGKSALGIDCSGLSFMAYYLNGIIIYRDASIKPGYPIKQVEYKDIEPSDLLYFPGHVAIYLGKGEFIHSTAQNGNYGVVVSSFNELSANYAPHLHASLYACGKLDFNA